MEVFIVVITQILFQFFRALGVRVEAGGHAYRAMVFTFVIQSLWLLSTTIGVKAMLEGNWIAVAAFLVAGSLGTGMSFLIKIQGK